MGGNAKNTREADYYFTVSNVRISAQEEKSELPCVIKAGKLGLCDREEMWVSCASKIGQQLSCTCCADVPQNHENKEVR